MTVYLIVSRETDTVSTTRVFASAGLAWKALDATASWIAGIEEIRKQFTVIAVEVEGQIDPSET